VDEQQKALFITSPRDNSVTCWNGGNSDMVVQGPDILLEGPAGTMYVTASRIQETYGFKPATPASSPVRSFRFRATQEA
jgi:hypothetical protein